MAHFAKLDENNIVTQVIVVGNSDIIDAHGVETESIGVAFCQKLVGADTNWKQTSYHGNMRGNYAGIGYTYMENVATLGVGSTDIFIGQQPYASWTISTTVAQWEAPIVQPTLADEQIESGCYYSWDEDAYQEDTSDPKTVGWVLINPE